MLQTLEPAAAHAVRADLLARAGRRDEAVEAFRAALALLDGDEPVAAELRARMAWIRP